MSQQHVQTGWNHFLRWCQLAQQAGLLDDLLHFLLTPEEHHSMALRSLLVHDLLNKEKTQRQIAADYGISIAKITRGSNALKRISPDLRAFLEKIAVD